MAKSQTSPTPPSSVQDPISINLILHYAILEENLSEFQETLLQIAPIFLSNSVPSLDPDRYFNGY